MGEGVEWGWENFWSEIKWSPRKRASKEYFEPQKGTSLPQHSLSLPPPFPLFIPLKSSARSAVVARITKNVTFDCFRLRPEKVHNNHTVRANKRRSCETHRGPSRRKITYRPECVLKREFYIRGDWWQEARMYFGSWIPSRTTTLFWAKNLLHSTHPHRCHASRTRFHKALWHVWSSIFIQRSPHFCFFGVQ